MDVQGYIDRCDRESIHGWVFDRDDPTTPLCVEILYRDAVLGQVYADQFREDLKQAGIGDGQHAFSYSVPAFLPDGEINQIRVRVSDTNTLIDTRRAAPQRGFETHSRFGGLWVDAPDWIDRLALRHRRGEISDELSEQIFRFVRDGFLIIEQAVSRDLLERVNKEIDGFWVSPPEGLLIETFEPDGQLKYVPPDIAYREGRTKLLDTYVFSPVVRSAIDTPKVVEFLMAIFEDKPKAFQSLYFYTGSQQAIHKDSAYVKVDTDPMHLVATWLALEDITPGTGELEYFVGSHRAPDYLFGGQHKWLENVPEEHARFLQQLQADAEDYKQVRASFIAKAGDVLIWHGDLAHGGAEIKNPNLTRRSLVTHITTAADEPYYRRTSNFEVLDTGSFAFMSSYASVR